MARSSARWLPWLVVVTTLAVAGVLVTWSATSSSSDQRSTRATSAPRTPAPTLESLVEAPAQVPSVPSAPPVAARALVAAAEEAAPEMTLGVAVLDVHTGELVVGGDGERLFMAASLSKLILAVDVLDRHRAEERSLDPADLELLTRALSASDDNAMNVLWGRFDGAGGVDRVATRLGLSASLPAGSAEMWGDIEVTAADMVRLYRHVLRDMAPEDGAVIVGALAAARAVATDGFEQHYGLLHQGASPEHYAKQAWVPYSPAGYLLHTAGVVYDGRTGHAYAIALLSIQPHAGEQVARDRLSTVAAAAMATLGG
ncbi:serine hydrolase [Actinophytocola glycyrrhizae]|uniref:Serine hydrolase n=1 Tax=Actinophytocola glycyrrhizae TaxID=2044873 RepID=A0ABV9RRY3_9PSEU